MITGRHELLIPFAALRSSVVSLILVLSQPLRR